jgi:DNA-binding protein H-NS
MAAINVDKLSLKELVALEAKLKSAIEVARHKGLAELKQKMADLAKTHGFSVGELFGKLGGKKSASAAKYANPDDKSDTWTGRGRKPNWVVTRLKKGAKLSDFAI